MSVRFDEINLTMVTTYFEGRLLSKSDRLTPILGIQVPEPVGPRTAPRRTRKKLEFKDRTAPGPENF